MRRTLQMFIKNHYNDSFTFYIKSAQRKEDFNNFSPQNSHATFKITLFCRYFVTSLNHRLKLITNYYLNIIKNKSVKTVFRPKVRCNANIGPEIKLLSQRLLQTKL